MYPLRKFGIWLICILSVMALVAVADTPAVAADTAIANLTAYSGTVYIRGRGSWAVEPQVNLPLFSGDKVVTWTESAATITFADGGVVEMASNSNLCVQEDGMADLTRRVRLSLGQIEFRTGTSDTDVILVTPPAVAALRGTHGILCIGEDLQTYLYLYEGEADLVGSVISSIVDCNPLASSEDSPLQQLAFVAVTDAMLAKKAAKDYEKGLITGEEAILAGINATLSKYKEQEADAYMIIKSNPDPGIVSMANEERRQAGIERRNAETARNEILSGGVQPSFASQEPTGEPPAQPAEPVASAVPAGGAQEPPPPAAEEPGDEEEGGNQGYNLAVSLMEDQNTGADPFSNYRDGAGNRGSGNALHFLLVKDSYLPGSPVK